MNCPVIGSCVLDCDAVCVVCPVGAGVVAVWLLVSAVMKTGLTLSVDTDGPAVYGYPHRFSCAGQDLVRSTVQQFQEAPYCILPDEDMVCLPGPCGLRQRGSVTCRCDWPQLPEVASELCNELDGSCWWAVLPEVRLEYAVVHCRRAPTQTPAGL